MSDLTPGQEVARRENCWRIAEAFMAGWNRVDPDRPAVPGNSRVGSQVLFNMTMELARFLAEPTPTLIEVAGGEHLPERLQESNDNQGEQ